MDRRYRTPAQAARGDILKVIETKGRGVPASIKPARFHIHPITEASPGCFPDMTVKDHHVNQGEGNAIFCEVVDDRHSRGAHSNTL